MKLSPGCYSVLQRIIHRKTKFIRNSFATTTVQPELEQLPIFRTNEVNPSHQTVEEHGAQFYNVPKDIENRLFGKGFAFKRSQNDMFKIFNETCIMVRSPAVEVINYLKRTNFDRPVNRYILYGRYGYGKSFSLNHILHYGANENFILLHCPSPKDWVLFPQEVNPSERQPTRMDTPLFAALWLQQFKTKNSPVLSQLELKTSQKYIWSIREETNAGESITNIVDHGINRIAHASDCAAVVMKEIKQLASEKKCKVLVVCDVVNVLYGKTKVQYADKRLVDVDNITIARAFKKLFKNDWINGAVVVAVERHRNSPADKAIIDLPNHLLTRQGFEDFDPFIPVKVDKYSEKEIESCLDYYVDRLWLQRPQSKTEAGRMEIKFLSCYNPLELYSLCSVL